MRNVFRPLRLYDTKNYNTHTPFDPDSFVYLWKKKISVLNLTFSKLHTFLTISSFQNFDTEQ